MNRIKRYLINKFDKERLIHWHYLLTRNNIFGFFTGLVFGKDLTTLAKIYNTDKWGPHFYTPHYQHHFKKFRRKKIALLEIGVGGYLNPKIGGNSLRMWKRFFPFAKIYSLDIEDKRHHSENRVRIFKGSQVDFSFLEEVMQIIGKPDIIIDDGSHINEHVIKTFEYLFPKLKDQGIYVVEDVQTSYWKREGGDSNDLKKVGTIMNFFKGLTDCLNYSEYEKTDYIPNYYDLNIAAIHFYHNLIFIYKGKNDEPSNRKDKFGNIRWA